MGGPSARDTAIAALILVAALAALSWATWSFNDADEWVNVQQAQRANDGHALYLESPSNHPPAYTWALQAALASGLAPLVAARGLSVVLVAATWLIVRDAWVRETGRPTRWLDLALATNAFLLVAATRAMNETLLLAMATAAVALGVQRRGPAASGVAWALAGATRLSAVFFAPVLLAGRRPFVAAAVALGAVAVLAFAIPREAWPALVEQVVSFQLERAREPWYQRVGKWLLFSGIPVLAYVAWRHKEAREWKSRWPRIGLLLAGGSFLTVFLGVVHPHYFLPVVLFASVALAWSAERRSEETSTADDRARTPMSQQLRRAAPILVAAPLWIALLAIYGLMIPQPWSGDAASVAHELDARLPDGAAILTDAPQYAVLSGRDNLGGYYWSLRGDAEPWTSHAKNASAVVVSDRFGDYAIGFHPDVLASLSDRTCLQAPHARIYVRDAVGWPYPACAA